MNISLLKHGRHGKRKLKLGINAQQFGNKAAWTCYHCVSINTFIVGTQEVTALESGNAFITKLIKPNSKPQPRQRAAPSK